MAASRFLEADKYAAYLRTPLGSLRSQLAWENLRRALPRGGSKLRALDVGGGIGTVSVQLAAVGFEVVLLDSSEPMLEIAKREANAAEVGERVSLLSADASKLPNVLEPGSFDLVVCHNLLEYLDDPSQTLSDIGRLVRRGGLVSVLVRNRAGEVLKAAIQARDCKLAAGNLSTDRVADSLFGQPVRVFSPPEVREMLATAGLEVAAECGVRVIADYVAPAHLEGEAYRELFELELKLGGRPEFAVIARYTQVIARLA